MDNTVGHRIQDTRDTAWTHTGTRTGTRTGQTRPVVALRLGSSRVARGR